ncbi:MAG: indole-3-glycerol phosphate synthase TrpC, partial [Dissulfurimicrobium sp.]
MAVNILDTIVAQKKEEVSALKRNGLKSPDGAVDKPRGFKRSLMEDRGLSVIAEIKKASPSRGRICHDFDPIAIAGDYQNGGARAISVITDQKFFEGDLTYLFAVRNTVSLPLLRKDFIIDHLQVDEARRWGADAILLITAILDRVLLSELIVHARELGMDTMVEVHDEREVDSAMA